MAIQEGHWGYCDESCLPGDITWYIIILIIVGTLTLFALVTLLVLYSLGKLWCLKKCFNNEQAKPDETLEMGKFSRRFGSSLDMNSQIADTNGNLINFVIRNV